MSININEWWVYAYIIDAIQNKPTFYSLDKLKMTSKPAKNESSPDYDPDLTETCPRLEILTVSIRKVYQNPFYPNINFTLTRVSA